MPIDSKRLNSVVKRVASQVNLTFVRCQFDKADAKLQFHHSIITPKLDLVILSFMVDAAGMATVSNR